MIHALRIFKDIISKYFRVQKGNKILRLLQSWPSNPRKQTHFPSTQSPFEVHELGHCRESGHEKGVDTTKFMIC